jgi:hypothetical protein
VNTFDSYHSSISRMLFQSIIVGSLAVLVWIFYSSTAKIPWEEVSRASITPIAKFDWQTSTSTERDRIISQFFSNGSFAPIIVSNFPNFASSLAVTNWGNLSHFEELYPKLAKVTLNKKSRYSRYFIKNYPLANLYNESELFKTQAILPNVPTGEFFDNCKAASKGSTDHLHFTTNLRDNELLEQIGTLDDLLPEKFIGRKEVHKYLWMGSKGVTAQTHFDMVYNIFLQVYGTKKFILFPPENCFAMYIFPRVHPQVRQSQVDFSNVNVEEFENFKFVEPYEAVLNPGDILLLPPDWFHMVSAESDISISVSLWTNSAEDDFLKAAMQVPIPIDHEWHPNVIAYVISQISRRIWKKNWTPEYSSSPFDHIWFARYRTLQIPGDHVEFPEHLTNCKTLEKGIPAIQLTQYMNDYVMKIHRLMKPSLHPQVVLDLVEEIIAASVEPQDIKPFLRFLVFNHC